MSKAGLSHVFWIGGAPNAGKSTVARRLAANHGDVLIRYDKFATRRIPEPEPPLWQGKLDRVLQKYQDVFPWLVESLMAKPPSTPILVEGVGLMPADILPKLTSSRQAIWLLPTRAFMAANLKRKIRFLPLGFGETSMGRENRILDRDWELRNWIKREIEKYALKKIVIDGKRGVADIEAEIQGHFTQYRNNLTDHSAVV